MAAFWSSCARAAHSSPAQARQTRLHKRSLRRQRVPTSKRRISAPQAPQGGITNPPKIAVHNTERDGSDHGQAGRFPLLSGVCSFIKGRRASKKELQSVATASDRG